MLKKICTECFKNLPATLDFFYKNSTAKDGLSTRCIICVKLCSKMAQQTEKGKAYQSRYHKKYNKTAKGKVVAVRAAKKFMATGNSLATRRRWRKTYNATKRGHLGNIFRSMRQRYEKPHHTNYKWYGGRGIKVCFRSTNEFINYVLNELQIDPRGLTIDRIDNGGNYERGNIRFVSQAVNNKNRG